MKLSDIIAQKVQEVVSGLPIGSGKSAYQIAVDHGFTGTEEEWLASLKGADGNVTGNLDGGSPGTEEGDSLIMNFGEI